MRVGVIGCGASGMMAAVTAGRNGHDVTVFEHLPKIGKKILATGNGKCNFTNAVISESNYNESGNRLFNAVYPRFDNMSAIEFFESAGIKALNKNGYYYPRSEQAASVLSALSYAMFKASVKVLKDASVLSVKKVEGTGLEIITTEQNIESESSYMFCVETDKGPYYFDRIIIASGSDAGMKTAAEKGYTIARKLGHHIVKPMPALCGLKCYGNFYDKVAGVRCNAKITLLIDDEVSDSDSGELQLTEYGISGIPAFQVSSRAVRAYNEGRNVDVCIDFCPEVKDIEEMNHIINDLIDKTPDKSAEELLTGYFNRKLCAFFCDICSIERNIKCVSLTSDEKAELSEVIKAFEVGVTGYNADNSQVYSGGIDCEELKVTLESRICAGLYFAGEIIDVNGDCGGYNLQWAWSSGYVAGCLD